LPPIAPFDAHGRFFRGNVHCHSTCSDGVRDPADVVAAYRDAGYDFVVLTDHFEAEHGWRVTDTRGLRQPGFTTILGAELSSAPWHRRDVVWINAIGLPADFPPPPADDHVEAIRRAVDLGAFLVLLHPELNNLPLALAPTGELRSALDAVEIYTHSMATTWPNHAQGHHLADGLLEEGARLNLVAADDAHFTHPSDRFGGWLEVRCDALDPDALVHALKAGAYYSTQGPELHRIAVDGDAVTICCSEARAIVLSGGGDRWQATQQALASGADALLTDATLPATAFHGSFCRVTVVGPDGRRAWSNPLWLSGR
jgi:hypothetical protein